MIPTPTKSQELDELRAFVDARHPRGYLAEILRDAAPVIERMIGDDIAWPIGETLSRLHDDRQQLRAEIDELRKQRAAVCDDIRQEQRAVDRARQELEELRGCARQILKIA